MTLQSLSRIAIASALVTVISACAAGASAVPGDDLGYDADRVRWTRLEYRAHKLVLTARSEVEIRIVPDDDFRAGLLDTGEQDLAPPGEGGVILSLQSHLLGRHSLTELWLEPRHAGAIQRISASSGQRHRQKTYRFGNGGVHSQRRVPASQEEESLPPLQWTDTSTAFHPYPDGIPGPITEPSSLFYLLAVLDLEKLEAGVEVTTFSRDRLDLADLRLEGRERIDVDYVVESTTGSETRMGPIEALRVSLRARSLDDAEEDAMQILGLEGDIDLYLEPELRFPLRIEGRIPPAGGVTVRLQRVELR